MTSCGWIWIYVGCALTLLELVVPGFVLCFFGLAAATVGVMRLMLGESLSLTWQLAAFSGCSLLYIFLLRRWLKAIFVGDKFDRDASLSGACVGRVGRVTLAVAPGVPGRVLVGDAEWNAVSEDSIAVGAAVRVVSQENLTLSVVAV